MKSKSLRVAFPTSLHLAQISLQSPLMPLATVPTEAASPGRTPTLGASLITQFPHTWNVLLKHLHLFKLHPKTYSNHLVRKRSRFLTVRHKFPLYSLSSFLCIAPTALFSNCILQLLMDRPFPCPTHCLLFPQISHHVWLQAGAHHKHTALIHNKYTLSRTKLMGHVGGSVG